MQEASPTDEPLEDRLARVRSRRQQMQQMSQGSGSRSASQEAMARTQSVLNSLSESKASGLAATTGGRGYTASKDAQPPHGSLSASLNRHRSPNHSSTRTGSPGLAAALGSAPRLGSVTRVEKPTASEMISEIAEVTSQAGSLADSTTQGSHAGPLGTRLDQTPNEKYRPAQLSAAQLKTERNQQVNTSFLSPVSNTSFSGGSTTVAGIGMNLLPKYEKEKLRVKGLQFEQWESKVRLELLQTEQDSRLALLSHSIHLVALKTSRVNEELNKSLEKVDTIQEAYRNPSRRILQLLGKDQELEAKAALHQDPHTAESLLNETYASSWGVDSTTPQGKRAEREEKDLDVELDPEAACMMMDGYARHRDLQQASQQKAIIGLKEMIIRLERDLEESRSERDEMSLKIALDTNRFTLSAEERTDQLTQLKSAFTDCQQENLSLLESLKKYEIEIKELRDELSERRTKGMNLYQECKEAEAVALKQYQMEHEKDRNSWREQLDRMRERKDHYKHRCKEMETIQDDCLKGRRMIQAEILELQETRRLTESHTRHLIQNLKNEHAKEMTEAERDRHALQRLKVLLRQQDKELRLAEELNLAHSVNPTAASMLEATSTVSLEPFHPKY